MIVHEAAHLAHQLTASTEWPGTVLEGLFSEGLAVAVAVSRQLRPGQSDSAYLWMDDAHQGWVDECVERADDIKAVVLERIDSEDESHVAELFTLRPGFSPLPAAGTGSVTSSHAGSSRRPRHTN